MSAISVNETIKGAASRASKVGGLLYRIAAAFNLFSHRCRQDRVPARALRSADHEIKRLHRMMHEHSPAFRPGRR